MLRVLLSGLIVVVVLMCSGTRPAIAQTDAQSFRNFQLSSPRVADAWRRYNDTLKNTFKKKGMAWPPKDIYLRAFKLQNQMELWARNGDAAEYKLMKTYNVCAMSGALGPKREQGDRQVPEGFYFIDDFNPKSDYLLSLLVSYPNYSDQLLAKGKTGGDIYIHGGCVTIGCLPMTNEGIEEVYTLCLNAKLSGQEYIPVHIYPTRMNRNGINYLLQEFTGNTEKQQFWVQLKEEYEYFEKNHKLLPVMYGIDGKYVN